MTITQTNLCQPAFLRRIKAAILRAVVKANRPTATQGVGHEMVHNAKSRPSLDIVAHKGRGFEVFDQFDNDVTETVKAALRRYHANYCPE